MQQNGFGNVNTTVTTGRIYSHDRLQPGAFLQKLLRKYH